MGPVHHETPVPLETEGLVLGHIQLSGHADRLNGTGQGDCNQRLTEKHVSTVRDELVRLGIDRALIVTGASGDTQQVTGCAERFTRPSELQECLLPNQRLEVQVEARRP